MIIPPSTSVHPRILGSTGRKHSITQNVLAALDFDLRFTYLLAGWECSTYDALRGMTALESLQVKFKPHRDSVSHLQLYEI